MARKIWIENTFPGFQIIPMPAVEREALAAETSHPKDLEIPGNMIRLRTDMNISLHNNNKLQQSKRRHNWHTQTIQ